MTVYIEYAFLGNVFLDGLLLFLALRCARAKIPRLRLPLSALLGGGEAVFFPLISFPVWAGYLVKFAGGAVLALLVAPRERKGCVVTVVAFFALTFLLGGLLTAVYSFFDVPFAEEGGYLVEGAPVALILGTAGLFFATVSAAARWLYRYRKRRENLLPCVIEEGERAVEWRGLADSGNLLFFRGEPVCVIPAAGALALFHGRSPVGRINIKTVAGSREAPVFRADSMRIGKTVYRNVCFTVGEVPSKEYSVILHTAFTEGRNENSDSAEKVA